MKLTCANGSKTRKREEKSTKKKKTISEVNIHAMWFQRWLSLGLNFLIIIASTWTPLFPAGFCRWRSPAPAWSWRPAAFCIPGPAVRCLSERWRVLPRACWSCSGSQRAWRCTEPPSLLTCSPAPVSVSEQSRTRGSGTQTAAHTLNLHTRLLS